MDICEICGKNPVERDGENVCRECEEHAVSCPTCGAVYREDGDEIGDDGRCYACRTDDGEGNPNDDAERAIESATAQWLVADRVASDASAACDKTLAAVRLASNAKCVVEVQIETVRDEIARLNDKIASAILDAPAYVLMRDALQPVLNTYTSYTLDDASAKLIAAQKAYETACQVWLDAKAAADALWTQRRRAARAYTIANR